MIHRIAAFFLILLLLLACGPTQVVRVQTEPREELLNRKSKYLKLYMRDGSLYILDDWQIDDTQKQITGTGRHYDIKRNLTGLRLKTPETSTTGFDINQEAVVLAETNRLKNNVGTLAEIMVVGVPYALTAIYCIADPKACFGSCPTFYAQHGDSWQLVAEGFSSSILPVFEEADIDMLYWTKNQGPEFRLKLTNEALETHVIRYADVLAFPHEPGKQVFATASGAFRKVEDIHPPSACMAPEGPCLGEVSAMDHRERFSTAGTEDLGEKEELLVSFHNPSAGKAALLIGMRQTLLTTYLFYQGLAYTGDYTGYFISCIENGNQYMKNRVSKLWDKLGGIEVWLKNETGRWELVEVLDEMGPIAADVHLVELPENLPENATIKLRMTRGLWRIDYLAMGNICQEATPVVLYPQAVWKEERLAPALLELLNDTSKYLVTLPGDKLLIDYSLPDDREYELFLHSKGYYLEWMRDAWLPEQDLGKARLMYAFPGIFLRRAAKDFKQREASMEKTFWESRYVKH